MAVFPSPESETEHALLCVAYGACADQFRLAGSTPRPSACTPTRRRRTIVVTRPTDDGGIPVTGERDRIALLCGAYGACADQFAPCWLHTPPERVNTHAAPTPLLSSGPPTMAVFPSPESETESPCPARPIGACADQFCLLAPHPARAREHPRGADNIVVNRPTDDGGIPVTGKRDRRALRCGAYGACADQFRLAGSTPRPSA